MGTDDGVARFDGVRFVSFGLPDGLPNGPARTLFADSQGLYGLAVLGMGLFVGTRATSASSRWRRDSRLTQSAH